MHSELWYVIELLLIVTAAAVALFFAVRLIRHIKTARLRNDYGINPQELTRDEIAAANSTGGKREAYANGLMFASAASTMQSNIRNTKHLQAYAEATLAERVGPKGQ